MTLHTKYMCQSYALRKVNSYNKSRPGMCKSPPKDVDSFMKLKSALKHKLRRSKRYYPTHPIREFSVYKVRYEFIRNVAVGRKYHLTKPCSLVLTPDGVLLRLLATFLLKNGEHAYIPRFHQPGLHK